MITFKAKFGLTILALIVGLVAGLLAAPLITGLLAPAATQVVSPPAPSTSPPTPPPPPTKPTSTSSSVPTIATLAAGGNQTPGLVSKGALIGNLLQRQSPLGLVSKTATLSSLGTPLWAAQEIIQPTDPASALTLNRRCAGYIWDQPAEWAYIQIEKVQGFDFTATLWVYHQEIEVIKGVAKAIWGPRTRLSGQGFGIAIPNSGALLRLNWTDGDTQFVAYLQTTNAKEFTGRIIASADAQDAPSYRVSSSRHIKCSMNWPQG